MNKKKAKKLKKCITLTHINRYIHAGLFSFTNPREACCNLQGRPSPRRRIISIAEQPSIWVTKSRSILFSSFFSLYSSNQCHSYHFFLPRVNRYLPWFNAQTPCHWWEEEGVEKEAKVSLPLLDLFDSFSFFFISYHLIPIQILGTSLDDRQPTRSYPATRQWGESVFVVEMWSGEPCGWIREISHGVAKQ